MARFIHLESSFQHGGAVRTAPPAARFGKATALGALLFVLAAIGSLAFRAAERIRLGCAAWAQARREREEDRKFWELALSDSRVMADLVALRQHASPH